MSRSLFPRPSGWSYPRLIFVALLLFGAQLIVFGFLTRPYVIQPRVNRTTFQSVHAPPSAGETLGPLLSLLDPTAFVLPGVKGFSGTAWLRTEEIDHLNPTWTEQPLFLALSTNQLLGDFFRQGLVEAPLRPFVSRSPEPIAPELRVDGSFLRATMPTRISFRGDLTADAVVRPVDWPTLELADVLRPTEMVLRIDRQGRVFSAALLRRNEAVSPDQQAADQLALELARQLVFGKVPPESPADAGNNVSSLRQTRLTVRWQTRPPAPAPTVAPAA